MLRSFVYSGRFLAKQPVSSGSLCESCRKRQLSFLKYSVLCLSVRQQRSFFTKPIYKQRQRPSILEKPPKIETKTDKAIPKISDIKKLMLLAKDEKYYLIGGITLLGISSAVTMSVPFFMGRIIDMVFKQDESNLTDSERDQRNERINKVMKNLRTFISGLVVVFTIGAFATFGRVYLMNFAGERVINRLRTNAFSSILKQEIAFFDKTKTGELINRLSNDVWTVGYATTMNISDGLRAFVGAVGGTSMMFYVSPKLAVLGLGIVPPVAAIAIVYGRYVRSITKQMNDALAESTEIAEERISSIRTVRAFTAELKEEKSYVKKIDQVLDIARRESVAKGLFFGFNTLSGNLIMLALLYSGGNLVTSNVITIGELSSFLLYALYVGVSMAGISGFYTELMHGVGASGRLFELVERRPKIPLSGGKTIEDFTGRIEFKNVHFAYPSRKEAHILKGIDLVVPAGSTLAIVGSSGSGKSTLASLLLRLYDIKTKSGGAIYIDGVNIRELDPYWLRNQIGTVNQEPVLFSCSIKDNISYGAENVDQVTMHDIEEAAKQANAYDFIVNFPDGFNTILGERGHTLSGGQKQRIAIARALLKKPKILLMDEATSALDSESEHLVREALDPLLHDSERTVIIIAHRLSTILNADQIAVLADGKVVEIGTYWQLMGIENGVFRKLVERQTVGFLEEEEEEAVEAEAEVDEEVEEEKTTSTAKV